MISNLDQASWDRKVIELGGSILQSWAWGQFQESLGHKIYRLSGDDFAVLAIETALPLGKKYIYCPRGPLGNCPAALSDLKIFTDDRSIIFIRLEPSQKLNLPISPKETQPQQTWLLDLAKSEEELLMGMKPKTRYNINLASRKGVVVREGGKEDLIELYKLFLETASRASFRLHAQNYYWQMFEALAPDRLKLLVAEYRGQILAGMILTLFGDTATYLHGGSGNKVREAMAPYLLHWEAIKRSKQWGLAYYDFGGISTDAQTHSSWAGITKFKKSFGGFEVKFAGSFDFILSPVWYNVYKNARLLRKVLKPN